MPFYDGTEDLRSIVTANAHDCVPLLKFLEFQNAVREKSAAYFFFGPVPKSL